jgi:hypothetical protein
MKIKKNNRILIVMLTGFLIGVMAVAASGGAVSAPAGTHLMVQMTQSINSRQHSVGHQFTAVLEGDMVVSGTVVAPHGTRVYGRLIQAKQAGRVAGRSQMTIELTQMLINNQRKPIQTSNVQAVASSGSGRNTAGRTARGAAVGGIIGGRSGARTGAKVGVGVSVLTRGQSINIPAGTLLDFTLAAPFTP